MEIPAPVDPDPEPGLPDPAWCRELANDWSPDLLVVVDPGLRMVWTNPAVTGLLGYAYGQRRGTPVLDFVHPEDVDHVLGAVSEAYRRDGYHVATRFRLRHESGHWVSTRCTTATVPVDGATWMVLSIRSVEDEVAIERRRLRLKALAQSFYVECAGMQHEEEEHRSTSLLATLGAVLGATSVELAEVRHATSASLLVRSAWGAKRADLAYGGRRTQSAPLCPLDTLRDVPCALTDRRGSTFVEIALPEHLGRAGVVCIGFEQLPDSWDDANADLVALMCSTLLATVARCSQERDTVRAATHDPLTGLLNRRALHDRLNALIGTGAAAAGELSLVFADLNNFKALNDTLGHLEGDRVLVAVGDAITGSVRSQDLAARVGGDEFVVVFRSSAGTAPRMIQRLRSAIGGALDAWEGVGVAIGAIAVGGTDTPDDVLQRADFAMYHDKHSQRVADLGRDAAGTPGGAAGGWIDASVDADRLREMRIAEVAAHSLGIVLVVDAGARLLTATPAAYDVFGFERGALQNSSVLDLVHSEDQEPAARAFEAIVADPDVSPPVRLRVRDAGGRWHPIVVNASNQVDNPEIGGIVLTIHQDSGDISDRDTSRLAAGLRAAVDEVAAPLLVVDGEGLVSHANTALADLLGATRDDLVARSHLELVAPSHLGVAEEQLRRRRAGISESYDLDLRRVDDTDIPTTIRATALLGPDGTFNGFVGWVTPLDETG